MADIIMNENAAVVVPAAGDTDVLSLKRLISDGRTLACVHLAVTAQALDAVKVFARAHPNATLVDFTPANWAALPANGRIRTSNGNLATQAAGSEGYFEMDVQGLAEVVVRCSGAANNASVIARWSLTNQPTK